VAVAFKFEHVRLQLQRDWRGTAQGVRGDARKLKDSDRTFVIRWLEAVSAANLFSTRQTLALLSSPYPHPTPKMLQLTPPLVALCIALAKADWIEA
jgi:hypothetical protein